MTRFFKKREGIKLKEIASACDIVGDFPDCEVKDVKILDEAESCDVSFFHNLKYKRKAEDTKAKACFVSERNKHLLPATVIPLVTDFPYRCFARVLSLFYENKFEFSPSKENELIHATAKIGKNCKIGYGVTIGPEAEVGDHSMIGNFTHIGGGVVLGENSHLEHNVTIKHAIVGNNCRIKTGAVIGYNGFGFEMDKKGAIEIPHVGEVHIGNNVAIGANTTIDRGTLSHTEIGDYCRIDNLVTLGHNVRLGKGVILVAQVGIAGSTEIGDFSVLAGQVGVAGHLKIGKNVKIAAQSGVAHNIDDGVTVAGSPAIDAIEFFKQVYAVKKLAKGR